MAELTEEARQMVIEFQAQQQQLQSVLVQKDTIRMQTLELEKAAEELSATKEKSAYKIAGGIMISKPIEELKKEVDETKEALGIRMKSVEKMEQKLTESLKEMQEKLREVIK
jgi:prefoldin beta subunit